LRKVRKSYKGLKLNKRVVKLGRPRAKKGGNGDVAYIIRLDIMLVHVRNIRM
jgi:hypothetical protein